MVHVLTCKLSSSHCPSTSNHPFVHKSAEVEIVDTFKFLDIHITDVLTRDAQVKQCIRKSPAAVVLSSSIGWLPSEPCSSHYILPGCRGECTYSVHYCLVRKLYIRRYAKPSREKCRTEYVLHFLQRFRSSSQKNLTV